MESIVLIFPFFGTLPPQYGMWRASAIQNPTIDFMLFTDSDVESAPNIIVHKMSFQDFCILVQNAFNFPIVLDRPYKLCEYKQAYGYILQEYINSYDFWGFGDLDLVYGDLRAFLTNEILHNYKFFSGWGHLTLLRNDKDSNTYFMQHIDGYQDYHDAFSTPRITFFDEFRHKGCSDKWFECRPQDCWSNEHFDNIATPKTSYHFWSWTREWKPVIFEHKVNKLYMLKFENGELKKKESMYAHFQHRGFMKDKVKDYSHFLITPRTIIDYPKRLVLLQLYYHCRKRRIMTLFYRLHDYLIWRLNISTSQ